MEIFIAAIIVLLGLLLSAVIYRASRPRRPSLGIDEMTRFEGYATIAVDGLQEPTKGQLVLTDHYLHWQPRRIPALTGNSFRVPLAEINQVGLGNRVWWAAFVQPIVITTKDRTLTVFLEGNYFSQVFDARRQQHWIKSLQGLLNQANVEQIEPVKSSTWQRSRERRLIIDKMVVLAVGVLVVVSVLAVLYFASDNDSSFGLSVLLVGAALALIGVLLVLKLRLLESRR